MILQSLPQLSADLYRIAIESDTSEFQNRALALLKPVLPFDAAMWGLFALVGETAEAHQLKVLHRPQEMVLEAIKVLHQDPLAQAQLKEPGRAFSARIEDLPPEADEFRGWLNKYDIGYAIGTSIVLSKTNLLHVVCLHRSQRGEPFTETERQFKEALMPHLVESLRQNRQLQIRRELLRAWEEKHCTATADRHGVLYEAEDRFVDLLLAEWPGWQGALLPEPLVERIKNGPEWQYHGQQIALYAGPMDDLCLMIASRPGPLAQLSQREQEIAHLFAQGLTHKAIAEQLFISPATVRNHLAHVYRKLGVSNKTELLKQLADADGQLAILGPSPSE